MPGMRYQPQGRVHIDGGNPLTRNLVSLITPTASGAYDWVANTKLTNTASPVFSPGRGGIGVAFNGTSNYVSRTATELGGGGKFTLFAVVQSNGNAVDTRLLSLGYSASTASLIAIGAGTSNAQKIRLYSRNNSQASPTDVESSTTPLDGKLHNVVMTIDVSGATGRIALFVDGVLDTAATGSESFGSCSVDTISVGARLSTSASAFWKGTVFLAGVFNRVLSDKEATDLSANPYQIISNLAEVEDGLDIVVAGGGPTIVSASGSSIGAANLSAAAQAIVNSIGSSSGTSSVASSAVSLFYTGGISSGSATNTVNSVSVYLTSGGSTSTATVSGNAYAIWSVQANTDGSSGNAVEGVSLFPVASSASGAATVSGEGITIAPTSGSADGAGANASAAASAFYTAIANAVGSSSTTGSGVTGGAATASSDGSSSVTGEGAILACASGDATGLATVSGLSVVIYGADGISISAAQVQALAASVASVFGTSDGYSTASGVTADVVHYTASGDKFNITITLSPYLIDIRTTKFNANIS